MCLFCRRICYYCSLQGHTAIYRSSFDFAGVLPLQNGLSLLKSWSHLCLIPNTWVPPLSEEVLGWAADRVAHRWNELPTEGFYLWNEGKGTAISVHVQLYRLESLSGFFPKTVWTAFGIYKATSLVHVFMRQAMGIHYTSDESIRSCWSHADPLRWCLDQSNTHQEPDGPEVMVCTPDLVVAISAFRWSILGEDMVTCRKGRRNAWAAVGAEHLVAGGFAHSCWDFG